MQKKPDAKAILEELAELRRSLPGINDLPRQDRSDEGRLKFRRGVPKTQDDFDRAAVLDALESFTADLNALNALADQRMERVLEDALKTFYLIEDLARDPAHADLIPVVENLRKAYERDFGEPIPPRE